MTDILAEELARYRVTVQAPPLPPPPLWRCDGCGLELAFYVIRHWAPRHWTHPDGTELGREAKDPRKGDLHMYCGDWGRVNSLRFEVETTGAVTTIRTVEDDEP